MGDGSPNLIDHNGGHVKGSDVANNAVKSTKVVQNESVAVAKPKEVSQEAERRQLLIYSGA